MAESNSLSFIPEPAVTACTKSASLSDCVKYSNGTLVWMKKTKLWFRFFIAILNPSQLTSPAFAYWLKSDAACFPWNRLTPRPKAWLTSKPQRRRWTRAGWDLTGGSRLPQSLVASRLHTEETHADKCRLDSGLGLIRSQDDCPRQRWTGLDCFTLKRPEKTKPRLVRVNLAITADIVGRSACWPDRSCDQIQQSTTEWRKCFLTIVAFLHRHFKNSIFNEICVGKTKNKYV